MRSGRLVPRGLQIAVVAIALATTVVPIGGLILNSFKPANEFYTTQFWPVHWTPEYYANALGGGPMLSSLVNSLIVTTSTTVISVVLGTVAAYGLSRVRYSWVPVVIFLMLGVRFYPKITTVLPYYVTMQSLHLLDTLVAVILVHVSITLPFVVLIMMTFFREIPRGLEEAAMLDGSSVLQTFRHVVLPLVRPAIMTAAVLTAMTSWNEFLLASSVTSSRAMTLPVLVSSFTSDKGVQLGLMSAVSVVIIIPIAVFVLAAQRNLIQGLTMGAVKE